MENPGACSPSRSVVSKMMMRVTSLMPPCTGRGP
jgi:hypothetical protein